MILKFHNVKLHNFLSYQDAEFDLQNQGYCLIKGLNNCTLDNALSNGSGKSTITSAISWCLVGETIQGIKSNVANILIDENSCWVELNLEIDKKEVKLIRYNKPKSDLKIFVNNEDKSGKGLKESEEQLKLLFPDLTKELISSTILFGQGLPDKLSSLSPSGRKDMLEKLSKSDFMIQDIKQRIEKRQEYLDIKQREFEDTILKYETEQVLYKSKIEKITNQLEELNKKDFDQDILTYSNQLSNIKEHLTNANKELNNDQKALEEYNASLLNLNFEKQKEINKIREDSLIELNSLTGTYQAKTTEANQLSQKIKQLQSIKDICPTCGQKIPNVIKPDTSKEEAQYQTLINEVNELKNKLTENKEKQNLNENLINEKYKTLISNNTDTLNALKSRITNEKENVNTLLSSKETIELAYNKLVLEKQNLLSTINNLKNEKELTLKTMAENEINIKNCTETKNSVIEHISVIKKINTLIKRDFRGYLLSNVINYIDFRCKEYSRDVFNHENIEFKLDGNNIEILFNNKSYEALSGGEKQKVDLLIQFAIRDMLEVYLGYSSNVLFLDEITDALDSVSTDNIFSLISNKLIDIESIFIISHHAESLSIPSDKEILVVKNEQGISYVNYSA